MSTAATTARRIAIAIGAGGRSRRAKVTAEPQQMSSPKIARTRRKVKALRGGGGVTALKCPARVLRNRLS